MLKTVLSTELLAVRFAAVKVCGALPSPQLTTTDPVPVVKSATVAVGSESVKVPIRVVAGVAMPSVPLKVIPVEPVIVASTTVAVPGVSAVGPLSRVETLMLTVNEPVSA